MSLHTLNKMDQSLVANCLQSLSNGDALLLFEEAVYLALVSAESTNALNAIPTGVPLFVLQEDLVLRGISARIRQEFSCISYPDFVALSLQQAQVVNWH